MEDKKIEEHEITLYLKSLENKSNNFIADIRQAKNNSNFIIIEVEQIFLFFSELDKLNDIIEKYMGSFHIADNKLYVSFFRNGKIKGDI